MGYHNISPDLKPYMKKSVYDPDEDGKISLGLIAIDQDLNMGSHNILLNSGYKVDGIDVSDHTHSLVIYNYSKDPTLYTHDNVDGYQAYVVAELTHDFDTEHAYFICKADVYNYETSTSIYDLLLCIGDTTYTWGHYYVSAQSWWYPVLKVSKNVNPETGVLVQFKVRIQADNMLSKLVGKELIVENYTLGAPT